MGRKRKLPLIENLEITDVAAEGKSIAKHNDMIVFIPGAVPGDIVDVQIKRKRRSFMEGYVVRLKKKSEERTEPFCAHFGVCGGCKWQNLPYEKQLFYKQKQVYDNLERIGKVDIPVFNPIIGSGKQQFYRNKLEYTFAEGRWLTTEEVKADTEITDRRAAGFHVPGKFDRIINIETCYLQDQRSDAIRNSIREFTLKHDYSYYHPRAKEGLMRNVIIRNTTIDEWMIIVVFQHNDEKKITPLMKHIQNEFPFITSLNYVVNPKLNDTIFDLEVNVFAGKDHIIEKLDGLNFKIGPKSFFQTNTEQALGLYRITRNFAKLTGNEVVYDLYTGTGTIANYIARECSKVIGIENVEAAIEDARINSELNNISNTEFIAGDMKEVLPTKFFEQHGKPDVIITDPPRAGMHSDVIDSILKATPKRIVYVSCNPATQARDLQLLSACYKVIDIQPVDMFPHTHHVENLVQLEIK